VSTRSLSRNSGAGDWAFPETLRPDPKQLQFDLSHASQAMVLVRSHVPEDALTANSLGTERLGYGVSIGDDGLILTIGYLIIEAQTIWITSHDGTTVAGHAVAYDHVSGFGLIIPITKLNIPMIERGSAASAHVGTTVVVMGHGGLPHTLSAKIIARRVFAGYWEYVLEDALFTTPAHPQWGGAAMLDDEGKLIGLGSLLVHEEASVEAYDANMFVPLDVLAPIMHDMMTTGRRAGPVRPWLGLYATEVEGMIVVGGLVPGGPAHRSGMRLGDIIKDVAGVDVSDLAQLFRRIWACGPAGTDIPLTLLRGKRTLNVRATSADRVTFLKKPRRH